MVLLFSCKKETETPKEKDPEFYMYVKSDSINFHEEMFAYPFWGKEYGLGKGMQFNTAHFNDATGKHYGGQINIKMPSKYTKSYKGFLNKDNFDSFTGSVIFQRPVMYNKSFKNTSFISTKDSKIFIDWNGSDTITGYFKGKAMGSTYHINIDSCSFKLKIIYK